MKDFINLFSRLTLLTQLGLTFVTPPILLTLGAVWVQEKTGIGDWLVIAAVLVGVISGVCGAASLIRAELARDRREEKKKNTKPR